MTSAPTAARDARPHVSGPPSCGWCGGNRSGPADGWPRVRATVARTRRRTRSAGASCWPRTRRRLPPGHHTEASVEQADDGHQRGRPRWTNTTSRSPTMNVGVPGPPAELADVPADERQGLQGFGRPFEHLFRPKRDVGHDQPFRAALFETRRGRDDLAEENVTGRADQRFEGGRRDDGGADERLPTGERDQRARRCGRGIGWSSRNP